MKKMPKQKPGKSKQDYGTPKSFLESVQMVYGPIVWDLAASAANSKAGSCFYDEKQDSLKQDWYKLSKMFPHGWLWLNPPFANIGQWAKKCHEESQLGANILMLTPASVGSNWFAKYCHNNCNVVFIRPRLTFDGAADPYPKDCMLTVWQPNSDPGYEIWDWVKEN
jgi:phage N-6-adenine-methyltransferase